MTSPRDFFMIVDGAIAKHNARLEKADVDEGEHPAWRSWKISLPPDIVVEINIFEETGGVFCSITPIFRDKSDLYLPEKRLFDKAISLDNIYDGILHAAKMLSGFIEITKSITREILNNPRYDYTEITLMNFSKEKASLTFGISYSREGTIFLGTVVFTAHTDRYEITSDCKGMRDGKFSGHRWGINPVLFSNAGEVKPILKRINEGLQNTSINKPAPVPYNGKLEANSIFKKIQENPGIYGENVVIAHFGQKRRR